MRRTPAGRPQLQASGPDLEAEALLINGTPFPFVESAYRSFRLLLLHSVFLSSSFKLGIRGLAGIAVGICDRAL